MFRGTAELLRMSWRQDARKLSVALALMAVNAVAAPLAALWLKKLTDDVVAGHAAGVARTASSSPCGYSGRSPPPTSRTSPTSRSPNSMC